MRRVAPRCLMRSYMKCDLGSLSFLIVKYVCCVPCAYVRARLCRSLSLVRERQPAAGTLVLLLRCRRGRWHPSDIYHTYMHITDKRAARAAACSVGERAWRSTQTDWPKELCVEYTERRSPVKLLPLSRCFLCDLQLLFPLQGFMCRSASFDGNPRRRAPPS